MFATAESFVRRGKLDMDQFLWMGLQQGTPGPDGHLYSRKGLGVPLLSLPLVWLGIKVPSFGIVKTALLLNAFITAASGAMLCRLVIELDYSEETAIAVALLSGLATPAWAYAKTFFSEPLISLGLLGCAYFLERFKTVGQWQVLLAAGAMLALAPLGKTVYLVFMPVITLLVWFFIRRKRAIQQVALLLAFLTPQALVVFLILVYNHLRFGSFLATGYLPEESFSAIWWQGILGLTISPGKGLIWYAPVLMALTWASTRFFKRHKVLGFYIYALAVGHVLLFGKWFMWHGGDAWGPRFLMPVLPLLMVPLAEGWLIPLIRKFILASGLVGLILQVPGVSLPLGIHREWLQAQGFPLYASETFFKPQLSPLIASWQFLKPGNLNFAWMVNGTLDLVGLVLSAGWCLLTGWILLAKPRYILPGSVFLGLVLTLLLLLHRYDAREVPVSFRSILTYIARREESSQAIINPLPEWSGYVSNTYKGHLPIYGLTDSYIDPTPEVARWLGKLIEDYEAIWLLPGPFPPEFSGIERTLMAFGFRVMDANFQGMRLALYAFPKSGLIRREVNIALDEAIILKSCAYSPQAEPEGMVLVEFKWQAEKKIDKDYIISLVLLDEKGLEVFRRDGVPVLWTRPTTTWLPGEEISDRHGFILAQTFPPGKYKLAVRIYDPEGGKSLTSEVSIGGIEVIKFP
ncbi:MAG: hypothetical protein QXQ50_08490 [Candidatus Bathyarchaeia archaeon]